MHIGVDARILTKEKKVGLGNYCLNLLKYLARIDFDNKYTLCVDKPIEESFIENERFNVKVLNLGWLGRWHPWLWQLTSWPMELLFHPPDILFSPIGAFCWYRPCKFVVMIHDVSFQISKDFFTTKIRAIWKISPNSASHSARHADMIIVPSQSTKTDVVRFYGVNPEKITVIYEGYDEEVYKPQDNPAPIEEVKREYNIPGKYILYVGTLEPRKNIPRLVEAFHSLKKEGVEHKLVVAGKLGWLYKDIFTTVTRLNLENEVIFTGYIPQKELPILMGGAEVFAYPSLYEGFGLPPLEAMACGTPVIVSSTSSLPEVVGDAGILVDPYNTGEIAQAMYQVISDEGLRQQIRQRGLNRAKMFSWEKTAQQTLKVFESVYRLQ